MPYPRPIHTFALALCPLAIACGVGSPDPMTGPGTGVTHGEETDAGADGEDGPDGGDESDGDGDGVPLPDLGDDDSGTSGDDPVPDPDIASCSVFEDALGLFAFVNNARADYGGENMYLPHGRYKGIPWEGQGHENWTFSTTMAWDDGLAAQARGQAEQLAMGANPPGTQVTGQASIHNAMWIADINTASWRITVTEDLDDWNPDPNNPFSSDVAFALDKSNGSARLGLHYHDFGGDGPAINRLGIGGALGEGPTGECEVWWVLQFGP